MPHRAARPRAALAAAALAAGLAPAACDDPVRPGDLAGVYVLQSVAGDALPTVAYTTPGFAARVLADTLRLAADGTGSEARRAVNDPPAPDAGTPYATLSAFTYAVVGGRVEVTYVCPPNADCVAGPHLVARLEGGGLVVEQALAQRVPQVYARAGAR